MSTQRKRLVSKARPEPPSMRGVTAAELWDAHQTAAYLGIKLSLARDMFRDGRLPSVKLATFRRTTKKWLDEWIDAQREGPRP